MKRLPALVAAVAAVLLLASCTAPSTSPSPSPTATPTASGGSPSKPNIVFVLTDDLAMNLISRMPHVVGLQKAGTTMSDYHVVDSLCCPSRTTIFTGEYPHDDGVFTNSGSDGGYRAYNSHGNPQRTFALSLQKAGYTTGFMGKYLNGYQVQDPVPAGWNTWDVAGGGGYAEYGYNLNENGKSVHYGKQPSDYMVDVLSKKGASFIGSAAKARKPFMLEVATFAPHAPYAAATRYKGTDSTVAYPRTSAYDAAPADPPSWLKGRAPLTAAQKAQLKTAYDKRLDADKAVDDMVGNLEHELQTAGVAKNTYVVFSSDNGYHLGEYRLLAGKQTAFDTDIHVPLIVSGPGVPAGRTSDAMVGNVDLAPTFESVAGAAIGSNVDGSSMSALWHGGSSADWPQAALVEHHGPDDAKGDPDAQNAKHADPPSYEAVRTPDALYVRYASGEQEYYDTTNDPNELHNIASKGVPAPLTKALTALEHCHGAVACRAAGRLSG